MEHRHALQRDTVLDRKYRVEHVLGAGGFGITYEATDLVLQTSVAIKEFFPEQFGHRDAAQGVRPRSEQARPMFERLRTSFLREGRTLAQFEHRSIVGVLNVFEANGTAYMVMRFESGPSFKNWLTALGRPPTQAELDGIVAPILDALERIHAAEFLHRDIAPDNIIIRADGSPVIIDFGASRRVMGPATSPITGVVKAGFSPQEQYGNDGRGQGPWTDIYALAATLYRAVTGVAPMDSMARMLEDGMRPATEIAPAYFRPAFLKAIDQALAIHPKDRPQDIAAWRRMLLTEAPSGAPAPPSDVTGPQSAALVEASSSTPRRATELPSVPSISGTVLSRPSDVRSRRSLPYARSALAALVLLAAGSLMLLARPSAPPSPQSPTPTVPEQTALGPPPNVETRPPADAAADARRILVADIRRELNRVGCRTDASSPDWHDADQKALEHFARASGGTLSFPSLNRDIVTAVAGFPQRVCPLSCAEGERAVGERCEPVSPISAVSPPADVAASCRQINERAQLGVLSEQDRELLRTLKCR